MSIIIHSQIYTSISQRSDMVAKYGISWSWKPKVKTNFGCTWQHGYNYFLHFSFFVSSRYSQYRLSYGRFSANFTSKPAILSFDPLSWKVLFIEIFFGHVLNLERWLRYSHLLTKYCPSNMNIEDKFQVTLWHHGWRHHHENYLGHSLPGIIGTFSSSLRSNWSCVQYLFK